MVKSPASPKYKMAHHGIEPLAANGRGFDAGKDVDRKARKLAVTEAAGARFDLELRHAVWIHGIHCWKNCGRKPARGENARGVFASEGVARQHRTVLADDRVIAARSTPDARVEFLEVSREHRDRGDSIERSLG